MLRLLLLLSLMLCGCTANREMHQITTRIDHVSAFPIGTAFTIARQSYPSHKHQRIQSMTRLDITEEIIEVLDSNQFVHRPDADLVISFYRDFYDPAHDGTVTNQVTALLEDGKLIYQYQLRPDMTANPRDGALVIDVVRRSNGKLLRQIISPYYFGKLQQAMRDNPFEANQPYRRGVIAFEYVLGMRSRDQ